jgi:hypothetical protein
MTRSQLKRIALLLLCIGLSTLWSYQIRLNFQGPLKMPDFAAIYYAAHCALHHHDPYNPDQLLADFRTETATVRADPLAAKKARDVLTICDNVPTALLFVLPFALLPWSLAANAWMILTAALLALAAYLMWDLAEGRAPLLAGALAAFLLANCEALLTVGNVAGLTVALCVVAVWCFLKDRYALAGAVLLGASLVLKPHDSGLIWLYFLLAGGALRKRALQSLAVSAVLCAIAVLWIAPISPHWIVELRNNLAALAVPGGASDPYLSGSTSRTGGEIVDLQAAVSIFKNDPRFYNLFSYLVSGSLILVWAVAVLRRRFSHPSALLALASISALSILPIYHRPNDAKILLLAIPACALLWSGNRRARWAALGLTSAAIIVSSDIPLLVLAIVTRGLPTFPRTFSARLLDLVLLQPAPLIFLATGCFYLWAFLRSAVPQNGRQQPPPAHPPSQLQPAAWE